MSSGRGETQWNAVNISDDDERVLSKALRQVVSSHNDSQPTNRQMPPEEIRNWVEQSLADWKRLSSQNGDDLVYWEQTLTRIPENPVVLGSPAHEIRELDQVFPNAPNSMRDVESSLNFQGRDYFFRRNRRF